MILEEPLEEGGPSMCLSATSFRILIFKEFPLSPEELEFLLSIDPQRLRVSEHGEVKDEETKVDASSE
jgi:hypothetical protein